MIEKISEKDGNGKIRYKGKFLCDCGNEFITRLDSNTKSCGCLAKQTWDKNRTKKSSLINAFGECKSITDWSKDKRCVIPYGALKLRLKKGIPPEEAITTPNKKTSDRYECLIGEKFNRLTFKELFYKKIRGFDKAHGIFECDCGNKKELLFSVVESGAIKSCGCLKSEMLSEKNTTHGLSKANNHLYKKWLYINNNTDIEVCDEWRTFEGFKDWSLQNNYSENKHIYRLFNDGIYEPENCIWVEKGFSEERLYRTWGDMKRRCYNTNCKAYEIYGGRGIIICDEWKNNYLIFKDWALSHGYTNDLTIERKDPNGNYCPENCIWIPLSEQGSTRRNNVYVKAFGLIKTAYQWSKDPICSVNNATILYRIGSGWSPEDAITTPPNKKPA